MVLKEINYIFLENSNFTIDLIPAAEIWLSKALWAFYCSSRDFSLTSTPNIGASPITLFRMSDIRKLCFLFPSGLTVCFSSLEKLSSHEDNYRLIVDFSTRQLYNLIMDYPKKEIFKIIIKEFHDTPIPEAIKRDLELPLFSKKIITIYGPRRSGKSFFFYLLIKKLISQGISIHRILYINFEDDRLFPLEIGNLNSILESFFELYPENKEKEIYLFFDEIQNIENWEIFVRRIYEKEKVKIFITGSSSRLLSKEIATALRGRTISYAIHPLNFKEFLRFKGEDIGKDFEYSNKRYIVRNHLNEYIEWGSFPEIVLEKDITIKKKILSEYFHLLIYRDLAERFSLDNSALLKDLLNYLLTNITSLFSVNSYYTLTKQKLPVSRETVYHYLNCLEEVQYTFLIPLFSYSLKTQKVNLKKIICLDNGIRNRIAFRFSADKGKLVENLVGINLIHGQNELFYWKNNHEVDFIVKKDNSICAINTTFTDAINSREIKSLLEFKEKHRNVRKLILLTQDLMKEENGIQFLPLWKWLLQE